MASTNNNQTPDGMNRMKVKVNANTAANKNMESGLVDEGSEVDDAEQEAEELEETIVMPEVVEEPAEKTDDEVLTLPDYDESHKKKAKKETAQKAASAASGVAKRVLATRNGRIGAGVAAALLVIFFLFSTHIICFHDWSDATCTDPQICSKCGRTQGEPLGHEWKAATCTKPQICDRCGDTKGEALGHQVDEWEVTKAATCTEEGVETGVCIRCGKEMTRLIDKVAHEYGKWTVTKEATCTEEGTKEKTCKNCGKVRTKTIEKLAHTPGDWQIVEDFTVTSSGDVIPGVRARVCTVCGQQVETEEYTTTLTVSQKNALKTAASYLSWSGFSYKGLVDQLEFEGFSTEEATFAADHCGADWFVQAEKSAESYMSWSSFSRSGLIDQLVFEGFTREQAEHGADSVGL